MCGICGIVDPYSISEPDITLIKRMIGRLQHRGPDSSGYYRDNHAVLGHARLSIIDLTGGAQPLSNENRSLWITYNGELYNYIELKSELVRKGHRFRTKTDTEVVIHAFEEWGFECFNRFNGQWALALWNIKKKSLILSRDRLGIRPLYYTLLKNRFLFSSEIKALFADKRIERSLDASGLAEIFTFWSTVAPRTIFKNIFELEPGHHARIQNGKIISKPYWSIEFQTSSLENTRSIEENAKELRKLLVEASRLRFTRSDVPVGAYLSGGIDSSVTSAIITNYTKTPLRTFSIRFTDKGLDEGIYQHDMVKRLGTNHQNIHVSSRSIGEVFPNVIWHAERPILRTAPAPLYLLSELVRNSGNKVVVTGEGSDEVLAGYDLFREAKARLFLSRDPTSEKRLNILMRLYPWMERSPSKLPAFAKAFFGKNLNSADSAISHRPRWDTTKALQSLLHPDIRHEIAATNVTEELLNRFPSESNNWDYLSRAQWLEYVTLLSGYILSAQGDRMLMAHSVEGRFPFLDCNLVDFGNTLPPVHKLFALDEKHVLKRACGDLIPESILRRPKQPYRAPDAESFFNSGKLDWVDEITSDAVQKKYRIFNHTAVNKLVSKCRQVNGIRMSNTDNMRIVAVLSSMLVHQQYIQGDGRGNSNEKPPEPMTVIENSMK